MQNNFILLSWSAQMRLSLWLGPLASRYLIIGTRSCFPSSQAVGEVRTHHESALHPGGSWGPQPAPPLLRPFPCEPKNQANWTRGRVGGVIPWGGGG